MAAFLVISFLVVICNAATPAIPPPEDNTEVTYRAELNDINSIIDRQSTWRGKVTIRLEWTDTRVNGTDGTEFTSSEVWNPEINFGNIRKIDQQVGPTITLVDSSTGLMRLDWIVWGNWVVNFFFQAFPFDHQNIHFVVKSKLVDTEAENVRFVAADQSKQSLVQFSKFHVEGWTFSAPQRSRSNNKRSKAMDAFFSSFEVEVDAQRHPGSYFTQNIIPGIVMVCVSFFGLWIDINLIMPRLMPLLFAMVSLITLAGSTSATVPRNNDVTWLEAFALYNFLLVFLSGVELILVHQSVKRGYVVLAKTLDKISRRLFPGLFIIVNGFILFYHVVPRDYIAIPVAIFWMCCSCTFFCSGLMIWVLIRVHPNVVKKMSAEKMKAKGLQQGDVAQLEDKKDYFHEGISFAMARLGVTPKEFGSELDTEVVGSKEEEEGSDELSA